MKLRFFVADALHGPKTHGIARYLSPLSSIISLTKKQPQYANEIFEKNSNFVKKLHYGHSMDAYWLVTKCRGSLKFWSKFSENLYQNNNNMQMRFWSFLRKQIWFKIFNLYCKCNIWSHNT